MLAKWGGRVPPQDVELDQRHRRDGVLGERLDPLPKASELVSTRAVEVAPQLGVSILFFYVRREAERNPDPPVAKAVLVRAHRREQGPDLVAELAVRTFGAPHSPAGPIGPPEKGVEELRRELLLPRVEVSDRQRSVPRRINAPVHIGRLTLLALLGVHHVLVLVAVLAARLKPALGVAQHLVEVSSGPVQRLVHAGEGKGLDQSRVVFEHLLVMRNAPVLRCRVAKEARSEEHTSELQSP